MKKYIIYAIGLILISGFMFSCSTSISVTKRIYSSGYYVDISSQKQVNQVHSDPAKAKEVKSEAAAAATAKPEELFLAAIPVSAFVTSEKSDNKGVVIASTKKIIGTTSASNSTSSAGRNTISLDKRNDFNDAMAFNINHTKDVKDSKKTKSGGKSWIAALLLSFFLGGLGIHRFYLGYTWQGVVQLLTLGGCGVWALIDFIRIIIKDLKPKDGNYDS